MVKLGSDARKAGTVAGLAVGWDTATLNQSPGKSHRGKKKEEIMSKVECVTCSYFMFSIEILQ